MTLDELVEKARAKGPWELKEAGKIRTAADDLCPLMAVFETSTANGPGGYRLRAHAAGLSNVDQIIRAADRRPWHSKAIRAKLMTLVEQNAG